MQEPNPSSGFKGIVHHWRPDLSAAISVSLVALPLGLGIALASGAPPMAGLIAAIVGGVVTTLFRGSHVAINGPAAGLIVVVLAGVESLGGFSYVLAAIVISGIIQCMLGLLKMGKLGDIFPISVVNGMLATIGITIFVKQVHVGLGVHSNTGSILESIMAIPKSLSELNVIITGITVLSLIILIVYPRLKAKIIKLVPAPLWVLVITIPLVFLINLWGNPETSFFGNEFFIMQRDLITIPEDILEGFMFPDFSKVAEPAFWMVVISIVMVASIETLISTKAVDKLDHFKRRTNLNKDLFAVGLSTAVAGMIGGLPIITVIVRSSVNVNHNAKTKWSNFYHGILVLLFVFFFPWLINEIPQAALAAILIYTGYKLASPKVFRATLMKGWEQLLILAVTLFSSLALNLLWGIIIGVIFTLVLHWLLSKLNFTTFIRHLRNTEVNVVQDSKDTMQVEITGIANFAIILRLINSLERIGNGKHYVVNFARTKLVDSTVLDFVHEHREKYFTESDFEFIGLDVHKTSSNHPLALHVLQRPMQKRLTGRMNGVFHWGNERGYKLYTEVDWEVAHFEKFNFFEYHLLEYQRNRLLGDFEEDKVQWIISDLTYNDGVMAAREEHHLTVMTLYMLNEIDEFHYTKDDIRHLRSLRKKEDEDMGLHFSPLEDYLMRNQAYHVECVNNEIFLYRRSRLLSSKEITELHDYAKGLIIKLNS